MTEQSESGIRTPHDVAEQARSWSEDDWWRLEIAAFRGHGYALMAMARKMPMRLSREVKESQPSNGFHLFLGVVCLLVSTLVAYILAPLLALRGLILLFRGFDEPLLAWQLGSVALVAGLTVFYPLFRGRHQVQDRGTRIILSGLLATVVILLTTGLVAWQQEGLEGSPLWLLAVALGVALCVGNLLIARPAGNKQRGTTPGEVAERLPHEEQARIRSELTGAITLLAHRGVVSADVAQQAQQLPLGTLGTTLGSSRRATDITNEAGATFNG